MWYNMNDLKDMPLEELKGWVFRGFPAEYGEEIMRRLLREKSMTETAEKRTCPESWASDQAWGAYNMAREILDEAKKAEEG
jgi:sugar-specific transcriptional regulator TrmB